jgi:hypothetical protein
VSKIVSIRGSDVLIHFMCWSVLLDEWIHLPNGHITGLYHHLPKPKPVDFDHRCPWRPSSLMHECGGVRDEDV